MFKKIKWFLIKHNIIKGHFCIEPFIYIENGKPTIEITDTIKWLQCFWIYDYYKNKDKRAFSTLENIYPNYKGYFCLF